MPPLKPAPLRAFLFFRKTAILNVSARLCQLLGHNPVFWKQGRATNGNNQRQNSNGFNAMVIKKVQYPEQPILCSGSKWR
jgi:hypothetical protein